MKIKKPLKEKQMKPDTSFFQRYKNWLIALFIIFIAFIIFNIFLVLLKLQFAVGEEIILTITPSATSLFLNYGETKQILFDINSTNSIFCTASCSYSFDDISLSRQLDYGTFSLNGNLSLSKSYNLSVSKTGTGQNLYNFKVSCKNRKSFFCKTDELEKSSLALITLNYDLSSAQKELKSILKLALSEFLLEFNTTDYKLQTLNDKFFALSTQINIDDLIIIKNSINEMFNKLQIDLEWLKLLWYNQSYFELDSAFDSRYTEKNRQILEQIDFMDKALDNRLKEHNQRIDTINSISTQDFTGLAITNYIIQDNASFDLLSNLNVILTNLAIAITTNNFENYSQIDISINEALRLFTNITQNSLVNFNTIDTQSKYLLSFEFDLLCAVKGICIDSPKINELKEDREINNNELVKNCNNIDNFKDIYSRENNSSSNFIKSNLSSHDKNELNKTLSSVINHIKANLTNKHIEQLNIILNSNTTLGNYSVAILKAILPDNKSTEPEIYNPLNTAYDKLLAAINLEISENLLKYDYTFCNKTLTYKQQTFSIYLPNVSEIAKVILQTNFTPVQKINVTLEEQPPICCVFNKCNPCCSDEKCENNPGLYPIIFLHGHSLNKQNSAEYSLDAFNKIISRLEKKGYLNAGVVTPLSSYSEFIKGEWGLSGKPVLVKGSYYYTSYFNLGQNIIVTQKSENIETYAIRLKELIDLVKHRTGKDKVIVIAHSMGGLVARSYINIFGDQSIYKLILIATPNYGIEGSVNDYCPILGERKECNDMSASSVFIKRLNAAEPPKNAKVYIISGKGCNTAKDDGDGIVTLQSSQLPYAKNYIVEGNCTSVLGADLHKDLLNIDKYKATINYIEIVLDEEIR